MERVKGWYRAICRKEERDDATKTVPIYFAFFFVLNYTIGTGYLGIPFVFYHSGIITGVFTLLAVSIGSYIGAMWLIEAMARAQVHNAQGVRHVLPRFKIRQILPKIWDSKRFD